MAKTLNKLTAASLKIRREGYFADGGGLILQVTTGTDGEPRRSWICRVYVNGKRRELGLGSAERVTLAEARKRCAEFRATARAGADPLAERRAVGGMQATPHTRRSLTFAEAAESFLAQHESQWSNAKHRAQWRKSLFDYAAALCPYSVAEIDNTAILGVLDPIWTTKPETARRVRQRIEAVLDWAMARGHRPQGANPAALKGNMAHALPRIRIQPKHHPALPFRKAPEFWRALQEREGAGADALRFAILTGARSGEVRGATWTQIDFDAELWTVAAPGMKGRREHRVPLSAPALELLRARHAAHGHERLVFGSDMHPGRQLSDATLSAVLHRMGLKGIATQHGFRSTLRDWSSEMTAYPHEVGEMALAHVVKSKTEAAYRRGDLLEKRKRMMADWARYVTEWQAPEGHNVTPIRGASEG
jgi:integrase